MGKHLGFFAVIPKHLVQIEQYRARLRQTYKLSKTARSSEIAASPFENCFKCILK